MTTHRTTTPRMPDRAPSPATAAIGRAVRAALAVLLPVECAGCGEPDAAVCGACRAELGGAVRRRTVAGVPAVAAVTYAGAPRRMLLALKQDGRTDAAAALAGALRRAIEAALADAGSRGIRGDVLLVPVPSSSVARGRRGYEPVRLLVARAGFADAAVLRAVRRGPAQKSLDVGSRAANAAGSLRAVRRLDGVRVLVVDDVVTSGATLAAAIVTLREAGADVVGAATLADTPRTSFAPRSP